jgi:NADH pyrophosphatase NudC (nudix superfamily)
MKKIIKKCCQESLNNKKDDRRIQFCSFCGEKLNPCKHEWNWFLNSKVGICRKCDERSE